MMPRIIEKHWRLWGFIEERIELMLRGAPVVRIGQLKHDYFNALLGEDYADNFEYPLHGCYLCQDVHGECKECILAKALGRGCLDSHSAYQDLIDELGAPEGEEHLEFALSLATRIKKGA